MITQWQRFVLRAFRSFEARLKSLPDGMMVWVLAAGLFSAILFWHFTLDIETVLPRMICAAALLMAVRFVRNAGYFWVVALGGIAVLFNPFVPNMLSRIVVSGFYFACASATLLCFAILDIGSQEPALALAAPRSVALVSNAFTVRKI